MILGAQAAGPENGAHLEMKILIGLAVVATAFTALLLSIVCIWIRRSSTSNQSAGTSLKSLLPYSKYNIIA